MLKGSCWLCRAVAGEAETLSTIRTMCSDRSVHRHQDFTGVKGLDQMQIVCQRLAAGTMLMSAPPPGKTHNAAVAPLPAALRRGVIALAWLAQTLESSEHDRVVVVASP